MSGFKGLEYKDPDPYGYKRSEEIRNERDKEFLEMFNEGSSPTVPSSAFGGEFKTDVVSHDHKLSTVGKTYYDEHMTPVFVVTRQESEQSTVDDSYDRAMSVLDN